MDWGYGGSRRDFDPQAKGILGATRGLDVDSLGSFIEVGEETPQIRLDRVENLRRAGSRQAIVNMKFGFVETETQLPGESGLVLQ